jgi:hypothetical protein
MIGIFPKNDAVFIECTKRIGSLWHTYNAVFIEKVVVGRTPDKSLEERVIDIGDICDI